MIVQLLLPYEHNPYKKQSQGRLLKKWMGREEGSLEGLMGREEGILEGLIGREEGKVQPRAVHCIQLCQESPLLLQLLVFTPGTPLPLLPFLRRILATSNTETRPISRQLSLLPNLKSPSWIQLRSHNGLIAP